ncbi:MAG: UrcA family protein [Sphingomicrobium sp.]
MPQPVRAILIVGAALSMGLSSTALLAQPGPGDDIVINAPQIETLQDNQLSVQFGDLALDRQAGRHALIRRVSFAIDSLCEKSALSANPVGALKCTAVAWNSVRPQLDQLLRR